VAGAKQTLIEKKSENEMVLSEFNLLSAEASIYKLVGPVLAKQEIGESKYIGKEIQRMDQLETDFTSKVEERRKNIMKLQEEYKRIIMQAQQRIKEKEAQGMK
jgi:prefoldin beta subunit